MASYKGPQEGMGCATIGIGKGELLCRDGVFKWPPTITTVVPEVLVRDWGH